jgi:hypothetical protein
MSIVSVKIDCSVTCHDTALQTTRVCVGAPCVRKLVWDGGSHLIFYPLLDPAMSIEDNGEQEVEHEQPLHNVSAATDNERGHMVRSHMLAQHARLMSMWLAHSRST